MERRPAWQKGLVVSGFAAVGKSTVSKHQQVRGYRIIDLDSSGFSFIGDKKENKRNPNFVEDYMERITQEAKKRCIVLVSSHKPLREELVAQGLSACAVQPKMECKEEYLQRIRDRGTLDLVDVFNKNWENFINDSEGQTGCLPYSLGPGEYLTREVLIDMLNKFEDK